jgi:hypothetical protein
MKDSLSLFNRQDAFRQATEHFSRGIELIVAAVSMPATQPNEKGFYSSSKRGELPPGCDSKRQYIERCRSGDLRSIATKDGRNWVVSKQAYHAHIEAQQTKSLRVRAPVLNEIEADERRLRQAAEILSRPARKRGAR